MWQRHIISMDRCFVGTINDGRGPRERAGSAVSAPPTPPPSSLLLVVRWFPALSPRYNLRFLSTSNEGRTGAGRPPLLLFFHSTNRSLTSCRRLVGFMVELSTKPKRPHTLLAGPMVKPSVGSQRKLCGQKKPHHAVVVVHHPEEVLKAAVHHFY